MHLISAKRNPTALVADDDFGIRLLACEALRQGDFEVNEAENGQEALELFQKKNPEIILMDEPCSALDPVSTDAVEDLIFELKDKYTIVIVTHNMQQAARVSDYTAFLVNGELVEFGETNQVFTRPQHKRTEEYVTGRFG